MNSLLSIIVPVFNEKKTLECVLESIKNADVNGLKKEIIIIDDFSIDGTRELLGKITDPDIRIFFNKKNYGKGYSIRFGLSNCRGDFAIIQDADLEYNPKEYSRLLAPMLRGEADVIYGSRFLGVKPVWQLYYIVNRFLTTFSNMFTGLNLTDMETCYKCFTKKSLKKVLPKLTSNRFDIEPEITAVVSKERLRIKELPISYERRSYAEGKKIGWKDGLDAIWAIIKFGI